MAFKMVLDSWWLAFLLYNDTGGLDRSRDEWLAFLCGPHDTVAGRLRKTSPIERVDYPFVYTESGSTYRIGEPSPLLLETLGVLGLEYNPESPIPEQLWKANLTQFIEASGIQMQKFPYFSGVGMVITRQSVHGLRPDGTVPKLADPPEQS